MLGDGLPRWFVEKLLGASFAMLIKKAETPVTLNTLIDAYEAQFKTTNKSSLAMLLCWITSYTRLIRTLT